MFILAKRKMAAQYAMRSLRTQPFPQKRKFYFWNFKNQKKSAQKVHQSPKKAIFALFKKF